MQLVSSYVLCKVALLFVNYVDMVFNGTYDRLRIVSTISLNNNMIPLLYVYIIVSYIINRILQEKEDIYILIL